MSLGRAFIEVHADLKPFKKALSRDVAAIVKETQRAVQKAVQDAASEANRGGGTRGGGVGRGITPIIKPKLDTSDADRESRGFFRRLGNYGNKAFDRALKALSFGIERSDTVKTAILYTLVSSAIAASPFIGAAISGAITAGIGAAGIGAGIALAFQDARVKTAAKNAGEEIMKQFSQAADSFVQPTLRALDIIFLAIERFRPRLERIFSQIAPYVDDLAQGIGGFIDAIGPGLEQAFSRSGPFIEIVAEYLPVVGDALGYLFSTISNSDGARAGLVAFFIVISDLIIHVADMLRFLSDRFADFIRGLDKLPDAIVPDGLQRDVDEMVAAMDAGKEPIWNFGDGLNRIKNNATGAKNAATDLTASLNQFFQASLNSTDAAIQFESSLDQVAASLKENGKNLDINTEKGRQNVQSVNNTIKAAIAARDAKIKETGSVSQANAVYNTHIERLRSTLRQAGLTKGQIEKLIGAYDDLPPEVSTEVNAPGLSSALSQAQRLNQELALIGRERRAAKQSKRNPNGQGVGGYAEGGVIRREQLAWVGEGNKPEAIVPLTNPKRAAEVMNEAGLGGFGDGTIVVQMVLDGKVIDERVVRVNQGQARRIQQRPRVVI